MKDRFHLEMGGGEGRNGDFEVTFEGRTIGADMKVDGFDSGGHKTV